MINIAFISDLHNELLREIDIQIPDIELDENVDVLVLAGDIDVQEYGAEYAVRQSKRLGLPVIYVLGNHEFYEAHDRPVSEKVLELTKDTDVYILNAASIVIKDTLFIGATLWTDFELLGQMYKDRVQNYAAFNVNDYKLIQIIDRPFSPVFTPSTSSSWHEEHRDFIEKELGKDFDGKKVVVTHHAPMMECLPIFERKELISACYASNLEWMIRKYQPDAWLYGHIHYSYESRLGTTSIVSNPVGFQRLSDIPKYYRPLVISV